MKAIITVEQYDNGITIQWKDDKKAYDSQHIVALEENKSAAIGKMIWDDIKMMMDSDLCNIVKMEIEYTTSKH